MTPRYASIRNITFQPNCSNKNVIIKEKLSIPAGPLLDTKAHAIPRYSAEIHLTGAINVDEYTNVAATPKIRTNVGNRPLIVFTYEAEIRPTENRNPPANETFRIPHQSINDPVSGPSTSINEN